MFKDDIKELMILNEFIFKPRINTSLSKLPLMSFRTLCILKHNGGCTLNELAELLYIKKQQAYVIIKRLELEGLVHTCQDEEDKRKTRIYLSDTAHKTLDESLESIIDELSNLLTILPDDKQKQVIDSVHTIRTILDEYKEEIK